MISGKPVGRSAMFECTNAVACIQSFWFPTHANPEHVVQNVGNFPEIYFVSLFSSLDQVSLDFFGGCITRSQWTHSHVICG